MRLVESVKENGGAVRIFSSLHVSGERMLLQRVRERERGDGARERKGWERLGRISERGTENHKLTMTYSTELGQLSGVAGILRFPLPEPEDSDASDQDD